MRLDNLIHVCLCVWFQLHLKILSTCDGQSKLTWSFGGAFFSLLNLVVLSHPINENGRDNHRRLNWKQWKTPVAANYCWKSTLVSYMYKKKIYVNSFYINLQNELEFSKWAPEIELPRTIFATRYTCLYKKIVLPFVHMVSKCTRND